MPHQQLILFREIFQKNGYPESFISRCFKLFLNKNHMLTEKKSLRLVFAYLGTISLQTRTKLQMSIKALLNCCKLQAISKIQSKLYIIFRFKGPVPQIIASGVVYKFACELCNESYHREFVRHLAVRSGEHIGISTLKNKRVKPANDSAVCHHLLNYNYSATFQDFSVPFHENEKYLLKLKESLLIIIDRPSMNRNVRYVPLYLFE